MIIGPAREEAAGAEVERKALEVKGKALEAGTLEVKDRALKVKGKALRAGTLEVRVVARGPVSTTAKAAGLTAGADTAALNMAITGSLNAPDHI